MGLSLSEESQRARYAQAHAAEVEAHCADPWSLEYRTRFIDGPLGEGLDLAGCRILEGMCSGGYTTGYLLSRGALVTGLDISPDFIATFRAKWPGCEAICASLLETGLPDASFDAVVVMGGLHHVHPRLPDALDEVHRILKPGGYFCFVEPHAGSLPDLFRKAWYRLDRRFERNEAAVDVEAMMRGNARRFEFLRTAYYGNLAYLLVFSARVLRIPPALKRLYSRPLLAWEGLVHRFIGPRLSCYVVCRWRKRPAAD